MKCSTLTEWLFLNRPQWNDWFFDRLVPFMIRIRTFRQFSEIWIDGIWKINSLVRLVSFWKYGSRGSLKYIYFMEWYQLVKVFEQYVQSSSIMIIQVAALALANETCILWKNSGTRVHHHHRCFALAHLLKSFDKTLSSVCFKLMWNDSHSSKSIKHYCTLNNKPSHSFYNPWCFEFPAKSWGRYSKRNVNKSHKSFFR